ncbi:Permease for cytosine/purines, uracil, thiamine, allantoin, partial [mine drainage metagenome]
MYGKAIWNPVEPGRTHDGSDVLVALLVLLVDTISVNLAANLVGPAFDFSALWPRRISYRTGGYVTAVVAVAMMPWKILASTHGYILTWLDGYSALLGAVAGILIVDYYVVRRRAIDVEALYRGQGGRYHYWRGWNPDRAGGLPGRCSALPAGVSCMCRCRGRSRTRACSSRTCTVTRGSWRWVSRASSTRWE